MWRLLALTFAVAHGDLLTEDSDHDIHVFQKHSWPTSLRSNMLGNALSKTLHVHGNLDVEGKLVHGDTTLNITNLALKSEIPNITNLALKTQIPNITNLALKSEIPDITNLALKTQIPNITNLVNKTYVDEKIAAISTGDASIKIGSTVLTEQNVKDLLALDLAKLATLLNITDIIENS